MSGIFVQRRNVSVVFFQPLQRKDNEIFVGGGACKHAFINVVREKTFKLFRCHGFGQMFKKIFQVPVWIKAMNDLRNEEKHRILEDANVKSRWEGNTFILHAGGLETNMDLASANTIVKQYDAILKGRGARSRMLARSENVGLNVTQGYELDPG